MKFRDKTFPPKKFRKLRSTIEIWRLFEGAEKAHKQKSLEISEKPLDSRVSLGHPAGVPAKIPFSVQFHKTKQHEIPWSTDWYTPVCPAGVPGTPGRCPEDYCLKFTCLFLLRFFVVHA